MTDDEYFELLAAADAVVSAGRGSTHVLRQAMGIGHRRASALLDELERRHIVGAPDGRNPREVLIPDPATWATIRDEYFTAADSVPAGVVPPTALADLAAAQWSPVRREGADASPVSVTIHASALARVLAEAAMFASTEDDSEPRNWVELSVSGGWMHGMAFNGVAAGWARAPLYESDDERAAMKHREGWDRLQASAMLHVADARALARLVRHRGKADQFDRATVLFDNSEHTVYVERVDVDDQRDVRMTLTDYRGTTLGDDNGDPFGWMRVEQLAREFVPDEGPIGALRVHSDHLAPFARLVDMSGDGIRLTFGRQPKAHMNRPLLVRVAGTFTGYLLSLDPNLEGDTAASTGFKPFDLVDYAEREYRRVRS